MDLHWTPQTFWDATPHEFFAAIEVMFARTPEGRKIARQEGFAAFRARLEAAGVA